MGYSVPPSARRRIGRGTRELLFARSTGRCENGCGRAIDQDSFHVAHLRAHAQGGTEVIENLAAWCTRCNHEQGSKDAADTRLAPREWQLEAHDRVVSRIMQSGAATVSAAPGAGKTVFAGLVFETLYAADVVDRLVVLAPRRALVDQWVDALRRTRHLELKPHAAIERPGQHGAVWTYQALGSPDNVEAMRLKAKAERTLLVLDEVHHVGEPLDGSQPAWARQVADFAGTVDRDLHVAGVLNLSGTLWRSKPSERISTVRYATLPDGRLESLVDFNVSAESLIMAGQLRALDLFRLGARVRMSDMTALEVVDSAMADLDERPARAAIGALAGSSDWRRSFVESVLERLELAHRSLDGYHAKALIVAARQDDARAIQQEVNRQMLARGLRPLAEIAISDDENPAAILERFKRERRTGVLCTVDMAGEGYDCPDIAVVGYASNKLTPLYVRQVVARAMRVTEQERKLQRIIPAAIVVPDVPVLVDKLVAYLAPFLHEVFVPEGRGESVEQEDERFLGGQLPLLPRFQVTDITPGDETVTVAHTDGTVYDFTGELVALVARELEAVHLPPSMAARVLVAARRTVGDLLDSRPFEGLHPDAAALEIMSKGSAAAPERPSRVPEVPVAPPTTSPSEAFDSIEQRCRLIQQQLKRLEGWWVYHGDSPVGVFTSEANRSGGIVRGGRERAELPQLVSALEHERRAIAALCQRTGARPPRGV